MPTLDADGAVRVLCDVVDELFTGEVFISTPEDTGPFFCSHQIATRGGGFVNSETKRH